MKNDTLLVYRKSQFQKYRHEREEQGVKIISFALIELEQNDLSNVIDNGEVDVDITGIVQMIPKGNLYFVEKLFYLIDEYENINYLVEEEYANEALETLGIFFNSLVSVTIEESKVKPKQISKDKKASTLKTFVNLNKNHFNNFYKQLDDRLIGHMKFKNNLFREIDSFRFFNKKIKDHPIMSVFLLGDSGVGKTEVARLLHNFLDSKTPLAKVNFANYKSESSLASLIGSPPGYINSGTESDLVKKLKKSNAGILLIDEFEKANIAVHNFFLQLLEEGKFDDAMGEVHNLNGYIIIFTSNLDTSKYSKMIPTELRSRFDLVTYFDPLTLEEKEKFAEKIIDEYLKKSKVSLNSKDKSSIMENVNLASENNLRNIKGKIRTSFYEIIKNENI
ncbi:ATP-dependent Clp protease ATP-binding subunit [Metabacillus litoralis]|uniref:ATP-dependent Clp protease ATP-binding subunit n=1 Tax=Metabacillus litoralis TaxID=152268 RepID=A0A5C6W7F5_9BACI|nr:AAA family ATPase [Metabacillus litoralis]TXC92330.1 ATP-dependent Clp protease ATP-binding subunit [Metabacillus litoralis]